MKQIKMAISERDYTRLKILCAERKCSLSQVIRNAIRQTEIEDPLAKAIFKTMKEFK